MCTGSSLGDTGVTPLVEREHVHQKNAVICACIIGAHREIGKDELSTMLRRRQLEVGGGSEGDEVRPQAGLTRVRGC